MTQTPVAKRYVGTAVLRGEDPRLLRGEGRYLEDIAPTGTLEVAFVRSPFAHARVLRVDTAQAERAPGVQLVLTARDLGAQNQPIPVLWRAPGLKIPPYLPLAADRVRYVGEPVAAVVATDRYLAEDAAELVDASYEELTPVVDAREALKPTAPVLHPGLTSNVVYEQHLLTGDVDAAFARADVVVDAELDIQRVTGVPMERRGITASFDRATGALTVWATIQHPHAYRSDLAPMLGIPESDLRVIAPDMGGAFGVYYEVYPEDVVIAALAMRLRQPVKWVEDRRETFLGTVHAREQHHQASLACSRDGRVLAVRDRIVSNIGAYLSYSGIGPSYFSANFLTGAYDLSDVDVHLRCVCTNKVRSGGYRGFGAPQATFVIERLMDLAARRLGMDPAEIRRRNLIRPEQFPYRLPNGGSMDSGNYPELLRRGLEIVDYDGFRRAQAEARAENRLQGLGIACYTELTGSGPSKGLAARGYMAGGWETVSVRVENDGSIVAFSGASHIGQGIRTALAQLAADELGVHPSRIAVVTGDTSRTQGNRGSIASRSAVIAGQAMQMAAHSLRDKAIRLAAHMLEASENDIEVDEGRFAVRGVPGREVTYADLGRAALLRHNVPEDMAPGLEATASFDPPAYPFASGVHIATVEVDRATGQIRILRYVVVHDCGRVINPMLVAGQIFGASAQGLGAALLEDLAYDEQGQPMTTSLMDYLLPTAMDVPSIELDHIETPAPFLPTGVKGVGEGGTLGPPAAIANAVADALGPVGDGVVSTPLTPERVWQLLARLEDASR